MIRSLASLVLALVFVTSSPAKEARADLRPLGEFFVTATVATPFSVSALIIGSGAWANLDSTGWRISAYVAGTLNTVVGLLLLPSAVEARSAFAPATSTALLLTGTASLTAAIVGDSIDWIDTDRFSVSPTLLRAPASGQSAPGLAFNGTF